MSALSLRLLIALSLAAAVPCAALADTGDEVVVAAARTTKMPTEAEQAKAKADATALAQSTAKPTVAPAQTIAWLNNAPRVDHGEDSDVAPLRGNGEKTGGRTIHGSAGVSIGTGGYRSGYVSTEIPIGETGTLGLAYSQTDYGKNGYYGFSPYGYGPHGYGYGYGYGRGGRSQSLAVSFRSDDSDGGPDTPDGCAPGFRYRGQYLEPLWVSHAQADPPCDLHSDR